MSTMHKHAHIWLRWVAVAALAGGLLFPLTGTGLLTASALTPDEAYNRLKHAYEMHRDNPTPDNAEAFEAAVRTYRATVRLKGMPKAAGQDQTVRPSVIQLASYAVSPPVRDLPPSGFDDRKPSGEEAEEINERNTRETRKGDAAPSFDSLIQSTISPHVTPPQPILTFEGIAFTDGNNVAPPDTNGDVGPNDYVQAVNTKVRVYDKTGNPRGAPFKQSALFAPLGGICAALDPGDPIVLYDRMANRWLISQFSYTGTGTVPPYHECVAISKTGDPTGGYYLYDFQLPGTEFPDYPKFGVWPDGYYMTTNQFNNGGPFDGGGAFAFDRQKMLAGNPTATGIYFNLNLTNFPEGIFGMLPSDQDGLLPPPAGAPNVFSYWTDDNFGDPKDGVRLFNFHADFTTPANSTFTERPESSYANPILLGAFDGRNPGGRADIEQPPPAGNNTTDRLDSISSDMMYRLQYYNRNGVESLVSNFTVNVSGVTPNSAANYQAGIRYFELQKNSPGGAYAVTEQATFAPGAGNGATGLNRWLGSAAIDNQDNLAVGYSTSSTTVSPSLSYAVRAFNDPPNQLTGEATLFAGTGVQRGTQNRWGDYSALQVDPKDDCTFWFTSEYYTSTTAQFNWQTRIGSFKMATCAAPAQGTLTGTVTACDSGAPLSDVIVTVAGGPSAGFSDTTNASGLYSMKLAPGTYTVTMASTVHGCAPIGPFTVTITDGGTTTLNKCLSGTPNLAFVSSAVSGGNGNGVIDRDECDNINVTLLGIGCLTASNISATLSTSTPGVTVTHPVSSYPDITASGTGTNAFPFTISTSPNFICGTPIAFTLAATYSGGSNTFNFSLPTCTTDPVTVNGSLTSADPKAVSRLGRNGLTSACGTAKACPGAFDALQRLYRTHTFTNGPTAACVTITTTPSCSSTTNPILPVAYLGSFDPNNLCANYLGDPGGSPNTGAPLSFSVNVPANSTLVVAVQEANSASGGCSGYSITVDGLVGNTDAGAQCPAGNLTAKLSDPLSCTGPGNVVNGSFTLTNTGATTTGAATVTLPAGLKALPGLCTASVGTCTVVDASTITYSGTLTAGQVVTVSYQLQIADGVALGTQFCSVVVASLGGGPSLTASACLTVNCLAAGPGLLANAASPVSDQLPGSVLVYNIFSSSATNPNIQNTRLSITNSNQQLGTPVHLFFVDGASCSVADSYLCLTPNQTTSFQAFDFDPGTTGYVIAIAVDTNGCPRNFNYLIGDEYVKLSGGFAANLGAESFSALAGGLSFCDINSVTTTLNFDGISYTAAPRVLALDNLGSRADGNNTLLVINRFGGNLATGASTLGTLFGNFYDDTENTLSFSVTGGCQLQSVLSNTFPRLTPRLETFIPAGRSGWLKLYSQSDIAILGAAINANPNAGTTAGAFNQGHNLHKLRLSTAASLSIPIFPPGC